MVRSSGESWPEFIFVLFQIKPVRAPSPVVTTATETTTETLPAQTVTQTETVAQVDMTSLAGAGVVALAVGVVVGWLAGSRKSQPSDTLSWFSSSLRDEYPRTNYY